MLAFIKREFVLCAAVLAAVVSAFFVPCVRCREGKHHVRAAPEV